MARWEPRSLVGILRQPAFRRFWLGYTISLLGDAIGHVALVWLVWARTGSTAALGWLMLCYTGPVVLGGLLAGVLLDRFDRRRVMIADSLLRGAVMAAVPLLHAAGLLALWHVYAAAAVYGLLMMISLAGGPAVVPSLVRQQDLPAANALEVLGFTTVGVVGPPLAGLLLTRIAPAYLLGLDALSYLVFALALAALPAMPAGAGATSPAGVRGELAEAVRLLGGNPVLLTTTLMYLTFNIGRGALLVWLPVLADRGLGGGAGLYGTLLGVQAAGEVAGSLLAGATVASVSLGTLICRAQLAAGLGLLLALGGNVWLTAAALAAYGALSAPLTAWAQTLRMAIIPPALRGRAFALLRMLMQSGAPIGGALAGWLLPALGIPALVLLSAACVGLPGLAGARVRALREAGPPEAVRPPGASGPA
jgi:MFS family permease